MTRGSVPLDPTHRKAEFFCGKDLLDNYLHRQAKQDVIRKLSVCWVFIDEELHIKGYYTLSSASVSRQSLPAEIIKKLPPSYQDLPVTLLGRLAVNKKYQGQGLGKILLIDALSRSIQAAALVGSLAVIVDPLDEDAFRFYKMFGFIPFSDNGRMFIPMDTAVELIAGLSRDQRSANL